jgi:E3 ubiquitin-protein ligase RNF115/126
VAIGVVPIACGSDKLVTASCSHALILTRQRWEIALYTSNSLVHNMIGQVDPMFPATLDATECSRRNLICPWIPTVAGVQSGCPSGNCGQGHAQGSQRDPWWFMSLIAFAGATPTCLCIGFFSFKAVFRMCRCLRRRRHLREVRADACRLSRIQVRVEDLHLGEDWACSICLGEIPSESDLLHLPCKHTLHYDCAIEWLEIRLSCPMCRTPCKISDCAIYTTPSMVTSFNHNEAHEDFDEVLPVSSSDSSPRNSTSDDMQRNLLSSPCGGPSNSMLLLTLPNAISDEAEPWWSALPSSLANRACPLIEESL